MDANIGFLYWRETWNEYVEKLYFNDNIWYYVGVSGRSLGKIT
jgi:hypothetical protein